MMVRNTVLVAVFGVLLCPLAMLAGKKQPLPAGLQRAGAISAILYNAFLQRASAPASRADNGIELAWSDTLRTDANGRLRVKLMDDSILSIGTNSELRIVARDAQARRTVIQLGYGLLRAQISKLPGGEAFELRTPTAVAGVVGTDFGVDASMPGQVKFICLEGIVRITSSDPSLGSVNCTGGQSVTIEEGKAPGQPQSLDVTTMGLWRNITDPDEQPQVQYFP